MRALPRFTASVFVLLLSFTSPAFAQYMFLDTNGDGANDASDRVNPIGPTTIDIWVDTSTNRDGSPATCDADETTRLTINQWEVVLRAVGGTLRWGPLDNVLGISSLRACFADAADTTDPVWYHNGWGGLAIIEPGRYLVGKLRVEVVTGNPGIMFVPNNPSQPTDITSFGTQCAGKDNDNTYKLGVDWTDADGIGGALAADAGGPYLGVPSTPIQFDGRATLAPGAGEVTYSWDFGDGTQGAGPTPTHAYAETGEYTVTLNVTDGETSNSTWTTAKIILQSAPVARAGGPYAGFIGISVFMDGRTSSDENGDPLTYTWRFGDTISAHGGYAFHTYYAEGLYTVTLTVSDGALSSSDGTTARIASREQRPPVADAGGPYTGFTGVALTLNGSRSSDPDGDPLTYHWLFGDNTEGVSATTHHSYAAAGEYEVILEVSDGTLTTSDVSSATISDPTGGPPVVRAGGPYRGVTGQIIEFDGRGTTDPDGDPLVFEWTFGDGRNGAGPTMGHSYRVVGEYPVALVVSDGTFSIRTETTASISTAAPRGRARAFVRGGQPELTLGALGSALLVQIEPVDGSFRLDDVDLAGLLLRCDGSVAASGIRAVAPAALVGDTDGNGVEEVTAAFRPEDLRRLLGHIRRPVVAALELEGVFWEGGTYKAGIKVSVIPSSGRFAPVVRPNPFNPEATVSYSTSKPGRVGALLFDLNGRLVKTLLREREMDAGSHNLVLDSRADNGEVLSSGIYFLRITGPDGPIVTRVSIAK